LGALGIYWDNEREEKMKLSEALIRRADAQKRVEHLKQRLSSSARTQEDEAPPEDPTELVEDLERTLGELTDLVKRINKTNAITPYDEGMTLTDALAERDRLSLHRAVLANLVNAAVTPQHRYTRSDIKYFRTINVSDIQKRMDGLAKQYRELDTRIQEINWSTELEE
jgi:hypothetical protein